MSDVRRAATRDARLADHGLSIVEVVVAMFLLAIIAVAILPALWQGIQFSSEQSAVATATRHLNSLVEQARKDPTCTTLDEVVNSPDITTGAGHAILIGGSHECTSASMGQAVRLTLTASDPAGAALASASALVYIP